MSQCEDGDGPDPPCDGQRISEESHCRCHLVVPQGCENPTHPTTDGKSARRVASDAISLYPRDVRTLASYCAPISLSSSDETIAFALHEREWESFPLSCTVDDWVVMMT
jgi:hypothetical protein